MSRTDKGYIIQTSGSLNNKFSSRVSVTVKRRITFRSILLLVLFIVLAKPGLSQGFDGGLLAGFNGSQVRGELSSNGFHKLGLLAGAWVQTSLNDNFYWTMELKYSQKGSRMNPSKKTIITCISTVLIILIYLWLSDITTVIIIRFLWGFLLII